MEFVHALVTAVMRVPVDEGDVFGRHFDVTGTVFDQTAGEQAAATESPRVVLLLHLLRLERDVEGLAFLRAEEPMSIVEAP